MREVENKAERIRKTRLPSEALIDELDVPPTVPDHAGQAGSSSP